MLLARAAALRDVFSQAEPFPHVVVEDLLPIDLARTLAASFPSIENKFWLVAGPGEARHTGDPNIEKVYVSDEQYFPPVIRQVMHEFNSSTFLDFLSHLTGYSGLLSDPWFGGCGLHSTGRGGRLMIHADQDRHPYPEFHQILNAIYYVTPDWEEGWGGDLELWDREAKARVKVVPPRFNSMVIFYTGSRAYHGHPHPLETPPGLRRNSMAAYYYTVGREIGDDYEGHSRQVQWKETNELDRPTIGMRMRQFARRVSPAALRKFDGVIEGLKR